MALSDLWIASPQQLTDKHVPFWPFPRTLSAPVSWS